MGIQWQVHDSRLVKVAKQQAPHTCNHVWSVVRRLIGSDIFRRKIEMTRSVAEARKRRLISSQQLTHSGPTHALDTRGAHFLYNPYLFHSPVTSTAVDFQWAHLALGCDDQTRMLESAQRLNQAFPPAFMASPRSRQRTERGGRFVALIFSRRCPSMAQPAAEREKEMENVGKSARDRVQTNGMKRETYGQRTSRL